MMLFSRLKGTGIVGRDELATGGDWFSQGRESAEKMEAPVPRKREVLTEAEQCGRAVQDRCGGPKDTGDLDSRVERDP